MLSKGATQIKLALGISPQKSNNDEVEPEVSYVDYLSPKSKEFISRLDEEEPDEAIQHREDILENFHTLCEANNIDSAKIEEWPRLEDLSEEDRLFVEAMDYY